MGAGKSPLTTDEVLRFLDLAGWRILEFIPAPALVMGSDELAYRYHVNGDAIKALSEKLLTDFKNVPDALEPPGMGSPFGWITMFLSAWPFNQLIF